MFTAALAPSFTKPKRSEKQLTMMKNTTSYLGYFKGGEIMKQAFFDGIITGINFVTFLMNILFLIFNNRIGVRVTCILVMILCLCWFFYYIEKYFIKI